MDISERRKLREAMYKYLNCFQGFTLDNERVKEIEILADTYRNKIINSSDNRFVKDNYYYDALKFTHYSCYSIGLKNYEEKFIFLVNIVDKELDLLMIAEGFSDINEIAKNAREVLGFYDEKLLKIEKMYQRKYFPDKDLSKYWGM